MRRISIDFARASGPNPWPAIAIVFACIGVICAWTSYALLEKDRQSLIEAKENQAAASAHSRQASLRALVDRTPGYLDDKRWLRASAELQLPWIQALQALEHATKAPVFLSSIRSDAVQGVFLLDAEANSFEDVLSYIQALQIEGLFKNVQLQAHEATADSQGRMTLHFTARVYWGHMP